MAVHATITSFQHIRLDPTKETADRWWLCFDGQHPVTKAGWERGDVMIPMEKHQLMALRGIINDILQPPENVPA